MSDEEDIDPLALEVAEEISENLSSKSGTWENENLAQVKYKVLRGHREAINSCQFCSNDSLILTGSSDQTTAVWDVETGEKLQKYEGHRDVISQCHMNSDATNFASGSWDKTVNYWDTETGKILWTGSLEGIVTCCQLSHSGKFAAVGSDLENALTIWDTSEGKIIHKMQNHHKSTPTSLTFSPNDDRICTTSMDGCTKMWDLHSHKVTVQFSGHINVVSSCCFDKEERNLCTGSWDKHMKVWDVSCGTFRTQGPLTLSKGHEGCISSCVFSDDGSMLASGSYDTTVVVWDMETFAPKLTLKGHEDWVTDVEFSKDSKTVLSCSKDKTLRVWNVSDSDSIPVVLESKRSMGLRIVKCKECRKPFSISQLEDATVQHMCVFCRLQASRNVPSFREEALMEMPG
ncbi:WD repeat-containing protein 88-like [Apostichopus japonicus]|uniref:WD repeat-containing protein 88-like n=1 Tax=Stichopus japonicus TaxID=307972 RepID=UPI003AB1F2A6